MKTLRFAIYNMMAGAILLAALTVHLTKPKAGIPEEDIIAAIQIVLENDHVPRRHVELQQPTPEYLETIPVPAKAHQDFRKNKSRKPPAPPPLPINRFGYTKEFRATKTTFVAQQLEGFP